MLQCAFAQNHGPAAYELGIYSRISNKHLEAVGYYQKGIQFGCKLCADAMSLLFLEGHWWGESDIDLKPLGFTADPERKKRYKIISDALIKNPDLRLVNLEKILPLPPAELPIWRGIEDAIDDQPDVTPSY